MKKILLVVLAGLMAVSLIGCDEQEQEQDMPVAEKPAIYLYPQEVSEVSVRLEYNGELLFTYPEYNDGWEVTAYPDGKIVSQGEEYSYLFWDGYDEIEYDLSEGFVVKGKDTVSFLKDKLAFLGLLPEEYNEFIVYWAPRMINNEYNLITFQQESYTDNAILTIEPTPDSIQRVFMVFKALDEEIEIEEQILEPFERSGFAVIEWGGSEI